MFFTACKKHDKAFEVKLLETPFTFNHVSPYFEEKGIQLDSTLFSDTAFEDLLKGRLYSLGRLKLDTSFTTLFVKEKPPKWEDVFMLINFDKNKKPFNYSVVYQNGYETYEVIISQDTIFRYLNYGGSIRVEKIITNKNGEFIHLGDEKIWVKPKTKIKRTYEEMMRDMP